MTRYARVDLAKGQSGMDKADEIAKYLPSGYKVVAVVISDPNYVLIAGEDYAGWTMDDYVIPRLGSGLIFAREMTADELATLPL